MTPAVPARRPSILVVEDEEDIRTMLRRILAPLGDVTEARDGSDALAFLDAGLRPDLVITDVMMPRLDGLGLTRALKKDPRFARVPVLALTARNSPSSVIEGINAGVRHYLTKPFRAEQLLAKAKQTLGR